MKLKFLKYIAFLVAALASFPSQAMVEGFLLEHKFYDGDYLQYELEIQGEEQARQASTVNDKNARKNLSRPFESRVRLNFVVLHAPESLDKVKLKVVLDSLAKTDLASTPPTAFFLSRDGYFRITPNGKVAEPFFDENAEEVDMAEILEEPLELLLERSGKILEYNGNKKLESVFPELDLLSLIKVIEVELPKNPVELGQTWTASHPLSLPKGVEVPSKVALPKVHLTYKLLGWEKIDQFDCLKIAVEGKGRLSHAELPLGRREKLAVRLNARVDSLSETVSGVLYFYPQEGVVMRSEYRVENSARFITTRKQDWLKRDIVEEWSAQATITAKLL